MIYDNAEYNRRVAAAIKRLAELRRADPSRHAIYTRQINSLREAKHMPEKYADMIRQIMDNPSEAADN
jgi:hypothetical protein